MKRKSIVIHAEFVEAFLYFDFLWLVSANGDVWAFDIDRFLQEHQPDTINEGRQIFARNDLLVNNSPFVNFDDLPEGIVSYLSSGDIDIDLLTLERFSTIFDAKINATSVLDMRCYYRRAYVATENEVRQFRVFSRDEMQHIGVGVRANGQMGGQRVHDGRCVQFRCGQGAVNLSCGSDGGLLASGALSDEWEWRPTFLKYTEDAARSEFVANRVATVSTNLDVNSYRTVTQERFPSGQNSYGDETVSTEIVGLGDNESGEGRAIMDSVNELDREEHWSPRRLFFSKRKLYAAGPRGEMASVNIADAGQMVAPTAPRPLPMLPSAVLRMTTSMSGVVAELEDGAFVLKNNEWQPIFVGPAYCVRGYPNAKWYKNMITAVGQDRTELMFLA